MIRLITDMCCDLTREMCDEYGILAIPMSYTIDGKDFLHILDDGNPHEFYQALRNGSISKTSQINSVDFIEFFTPYLEQGDDILYLAFSSGLSGTYQSACIAAEELRKKFPERTLEIVDSQAASMGLGLMAYYASCRLKEGMDLAETVQWLENNKLKINHWFTVDDLHFLRRGGRVTGAAAFVGSLLSIKPVLHTDDNGKLIPMEKTRGRAKALRGLVDKIDQQGENVNGQTIFISHGDCLEDAEHVRALIAEKYPDCKFKINYIGPVIGSHSGPGTVAVFFVGTRR